MPSTSTIPTPGIAATTIYRVNKLTTFRYPAQLLNQNGEGLGQADLDTLTLKLYDATTFAIINSRDDQNVLNDNGVTLDDDGNLVWIMEPADNPVLSAALESEMHVALFKWTWDSGARKGDHEVMFRVLNIKFVP